MFCFISCAGYLSVKGDPVSGRLHLDMLLLMHPCVEFLIEQVTLASLLNNVLSCSGCIIGAFLIRS